MSTTLDTLYAAVRLEGHAASALHALGVALTAREEFAEGLDCLTEAVAAEPTRLQYRCDLGAALAAAGKPSDAAAVFEGVLKDDPGRTDICEKAASLYMDKLGDPERSVPLFLRAIDSDPDRARSAYSGLCHAILLNSDDVEAAIRRILTTLSFANRPVRTHCAIARTLHALGMYTDARRHWLNALQASPSDLFALLGLTDNALAVRDRELAEETSRTVLATHEGRWAAVFCRVFFLVRTGRFTEASTLFRSARRALAPTQQPRPHVWAGESPEGVTMLIKHDLWGYGDIIQYL